MWVPFSRPFPEMRHINFFLGPKMGCFGWAKKFMLKKLMCLFGPLPNLVVSNPVVCSFYVEALICTLLRSFADLCLRSFALFFVFLRSTEFLSGPVLRDTTRLSQRYTPIARYGVLVSQHGQLGAIPPPPFLSVSPLESMRSGGAILPLKRGISGILARYPMKTRQNACDNPPLSYYHERVLRDMGGYFALGR